MVEAPRICGQLVVGPTHQSPLPPIFFLIILIGVQFRALPPGSTAASVAYCTIPRFLNVPTLTARCLSRPQPAVVS